MAGLAPHTLISHWNLLVLGFLHAVAPPCFFRFSIVSVYVCKYMGAILTTDKMQIVQVCVLLPLPTCMVTIVWIMDDHFIQISNLGIAMRYQNWVWIQGLKGGLLSLICPIHGLLLPLNWQTGDWADASPLCIDQRSAWKIGYPSRTYPTWRCPEAEQQITSHALYFDCSPLVTNLFTSPFLPLARKWEEIVH